MLGKASTFTITLSVLLQALAPVTVTVYSVVALGDAFGLAIEAFDNAVEGDQE